MPTEAKYHVNPETGKAGKCRARVNPCRWGDKESHFNTEVAARAAYEMKMRDKELAEALVKTPEAGPVKRTTWLTQEQVDEINVDGVNCPHCDHQATPAQAAYILNEMNTAVCKKCDGDFDLYTMSIRVGKTKDTYAAFDAAQVSKMVWYHSTNLEDWGGSFKENDGFVAHLGSIQPAYDRRIAEDYNDRIREEGFLLFEVSVAPKAKISEDIDPDDNADFAHGDRMKSSDVVRYINKWEDMASISLAANTKRLKIRNKRFVTAAEVMDSPSLYNVDLTGVED